MELPRQDQHAATACLAITELLEAILLNLDSRTLLHAQRVSRKFHAVITSNAAFKQRLFLTPATAAEIAPPNFRPNQSPRPYMLIELPPEAGMQDYTRYSLATLERTARSTQLGVLNPLLFDPPVWRGHGDWPMHFRLTRESHGLDDRHRLPSRSPLRDMYLAHPMPLEVRFRFPMRRRYYWPVPPDGHVALGYGEDGRPRTLGEMMEEVERKGRTWVEHGWWDGGWEGAIVQLRGRWLPETESARDAKRRRKGERRARRCAARVERCEGMMDADGAFGEWQMMAMADET